MFNKLKLRCFTKTNSIQRLSTIPHKPGSVQVFEAVEDVQPLLKQRQYPQPYLVAGFFVGMFAFSGLVSVKLAKWKIHLLETEGVAITNQAMWQRKSDFVHYCVFKY